MTFQEWRERAGIELGCLLEEGADVEDYAGPRHTGLTEDQMLEWALEAYKEGDDPEAWAETVVDRIRWRFDEDDD